MLFAVDMIRLYSHDIVLSVFFIRFVDCIKKEVRGTLY